MSKSEPKGMELKPLQYYKDIAPGIHYLPTQQQYRFVDAFLKTESIVEAYRQAGYSTRCGEGWIRLSANKVRNKQGVMFLFDQLMNDWLEARKVNTQYLLSEALKSYEGAETTRDKIECLRFISEVSGLKYKTTPQDRKKK